MDLTEGKKPHVDTEYVPKNKIMIGSYIYCRAGKFHHLEGFEEMLKDETIEEYSLYAKQGAEYGEIGSSGDRVAYFRVVGNSFEDVQQKHQRVAENIKVIDFEGNDIMRHDLLTDLD